MFIKLMAAAFHGIIEVFSVGILGYIIIAGITRNPLFLNMLTKMVIRLTLPCLVFSTMIQKFNPRETRLWWVFPLLSLFVTCLGAVVAKIYMAVDQKIKYKGEFMALTAFQNGIFLPLAFAPVLFSQEQLPEFFNCLFLFSLLNIPIFFTFGVWMLNSSQGAGFRVKDMVSPPIAATLVSFIIVLIGWSNYVPVWITRPLSTIGSLTTPLSMLFVGGIFVVNLPKTGSQDWALPVKVSILKCLILPLIATFIVIAVKPPATLALFLILQSVMPSASLTALVSPREGESRKSIAGAILLTSLVSIITIPVFMGLYGVLYE